MPLLKSSKNTNLIGKIDFATIARSALSRADFIVRDLLPNGRREGREWTAVNPNRDDKKAGSFRVNLTTGKWADFATDERGNDLVSLAAYLNRTKQSEAARWLSGQFNLGGIINA